MRLTSLKPTVVIQILKKYGFEAIRQKASHIFFRHPDGVRTVIPFHKGEELGKGLIKSILNDIELSWEEFIAKR